MVVVTAPLLREEAMDLANRLLMSDSPRAQAKGWHLLMNYASSFEDWLSIAADLRVMNPGDIQDGIFCRFKKSAPPAVVGPFMEHTRRVIVEEWLAGPRNYQLLFTTEPAERLLNRLLTALGYCFDIEPLEEALRTLNVYWDFVPQAIRRRVEIEYAQTWSRFNNPRTVAEAHTAGWKVVGGDGRRQFIFAMGNRRITRYLPK